MIELFLGYQNNSFRAHEEYVYNKELGADDLELWHLELLIADLNHDHHLDLISKYSGRRPMDVSYGYGNGTFQDPTSLGIYVDNSVTSVVLGDLNNDTYVDFILTKRFENEMIVHLGTQNGDSPMEPNYRMNVSEQPWSVALVDLTADGILDLVFGSTSGQFGTLLGVGDGSFHREKIHPIPATGTIMQAMPCDLNEDGLADLALVYFPPSSLLVMLNEGNRTFRKHHRQTHPSRLFIQVTTRRSESRPSSGRCRGIWFSDQNHQDPFWLW